MVQTLLIIVLSVLAIPVMVFAAQVLFAILTRNKQVAAVESIKRPNCAVLIPAHNETLVIAQTLTCILPQLTSQDQLLVVADNCSDDTADLARQLGASVVERQHLTQRGKGYALDYGLQQLKHNPPQVVIIIDADCLISQGAIAKLAQACVQHQRPIQALYDMQMQANPSIKARVAAFAWIVKNKVRPLGYQAIGLPCQLMGTGMAFLWQDIIKVNLASGHIVEDMKLGVDLTRHNKAPLFMQDVCVTSAFPPTETATNTQRARWEHGHLSVIINEAPKLILEALRQKNSQMFGLALDLIVPPLAVLVMLCTLLLLITLLIHQFISVHFSLNVAVGLLIILSMAVFWAWLFFGRRVISLRQLSYAPLYALSKIPLYIKFFINRQVEWVRSKRD
jgi:cellulose synthase/poly-beta-1,6-N-acetylglucosamine synthase-like glycosyltransferase